MKKKTFIIAEAGVNHNGSLDLAQQLIAEAAQAGVDAIKFQTFKAAKMTSQSAPKAKYQKETTGEHESQLAMIRKLELNAEAHHKLMKNCKDKNVLFLSSPFDLESIALLDQLGLQVIKIPSGEITNLPYLQKVGALKKQIIMSTGMSDLDEIIQALNILISAGTKKDNITLLHCNTEYPTPMTDVNLSAMLTIKEKLNIAVGYSDHTLGIEVPIAAVALGAVVIEKHFTLDRNLVGPDHKASLEPQQLKDMVQAIRNIDIALGDGVKRPSPSELKNQPIARKSIVAACDIHNGDLFTEENITTKRPGTGISPMEWPRVIGQFAKRNFKKDEMIKL